MVGGGVAGAFAAYFLTQAGVGVTVVDRADAGAASPNNPGGLNPLYGPGIPGPLQPLALAAFALHLGAWDDIANRSGIDFAGRRKQRLNLAVDDVDLARLEAMKANYDARPGFGARWLSGDEVRQREPRLSTTIVRGLLAEGDARVDAPAYTRAVRRAAEVLGANLVTDTVTGLDLDGRRVAGVRTLAGERSCDAVVIATGAWGDDTASWLGAALPMEPVLGDMLLARVAGGGVTTDLAWRDGAIYQADDDEVWLGGTEEHRGFDSAPTSAGAATVIERVRPVFPAAADGEILRHTTGLRPLTPDGQPVIGLVAGFDNVCVVTGGGRKGMLYAAAMGAAARDLLMSGRTELPVGPCSPGRFVEAGRP